jgi:hypothetical protein
MKQPSLLDLMRQARTMTEAEALPSAGASQELCKVFQWSLDDFKGFMSSMAALEAKERETKEWNGKGKCPVCGRGPDAVDLGTEKALAAAEQFLRENQPESTK